MPVVGVGPGDEGNTPLVFRSGICAQDVISKTGPSVDAGTIWLSRDAGFSGHTEVNVLFG